MDILVSIFMFWMQIVVDILSETIWRKDTWKN